MTDYKPGTVARLKTWGKDATAVRYSSGWAYVHDASDTLAGTVGCSVDAHGELTDIRPLVVLDLAEVQREAFAGDILERLRRVAETGSTDGWAATKDVIAAIADQIEAQTKPTRIPEPGDWGVVEAGHRDHARFRRKWVRHVSGQWFTAAKASSVAWSELIEPVLVREGVDD